MEMENMAEAQDSQRVQPELGQMFGSFDEFKKFLEKYQQQEKQVFTIKDCKRLAEECERLKYSTVHFECKFGERRKCEASGSRKSSTFKVDCSAGIKLRATAGKSILKIFYVNLEHSNHQNSKEFFELIPENRRLAPTQKEIALKALELRPNRKLLQNKIADDDNKFVTLKDLSNLNQKRKVDENDLTVAVELLQKEYGATVSLLHDNGKFKGLFFATEEMRRDMASWPEIVFVDGTYKLLNTNLTTMIFLIEDGNGRGQVAAVGLLSTEEEYVLHWLANTFRQKNEDSTESIKCFMTDKDLVERNVLKQVFPNKAIYLCLFHTLRSFSRAVSTEKMGITKEEREKSLRYLQKLAYSSSEEEYEKLYATFAEAVPGQVLQYFNENWHNIKNEWTVYNMSEGNLGNLTNNRLESLNAKLKQVIPKNSTLVGFVKSFFKWYQSHKMETKFRTGNQILKRPVIAETDTSEDEQKFRQLLTKTACDHIMEQMNLHSAITFVKTDSSSKTGYMRLKGNEIKAEPGYCDCPIWKSSRLPCRHIFAVRKHFELELFGRELCTARWTKEHALANLRNNEDNTEYEETIFPPTPVISKIIRKEVLTVAQKRKMLAPDVAEILNLGSLACGKDFEERRKTLESILTAWRQGLHVEIKTADCSNIAPSSSSISSPSSNTSATSSTITTSTSNTQELETGTATATIDEITIEDIDMPKPPRITGHPSGYLKTTTGIKRKSATATPFAGKIQDCQKREMLAWVVKDTILELTLHGEHIINTQDLDLEHREIRDSFMDESIDVMLIRPYIEAEAFKKFKTAVQQKKEKGIYTCGSCFNRLKTESVVCESCLLWYDFTCVGLKRAPSKSDWFCPKCNGQAKQKKNRQ